MDTIKNYLDNMFSTLPQNNEIQRARAELEAMMEDKYNELKEEGASENEAVGAVISEFGNIDEVLVGMGYKTASQANVTEGIDDDENASEAKDHGESFKKTRKQRRAEKRKYAEDEREEDIYINEKAATVMSVYWPTVTCIYLILSFLVWGWGITWIIWPIAGVMFALLKRILRVI